MPTSNDFDPISDPYSAVLAKEQDPYDEVLKRHDPYEAILQQNPAPVAKPPLSDPAESPDYGTIISTAASKGASEGWHEVTDLASGIGRKISGEGFFPTGPKAPEAPSEIDYLLQKPIDEGWSDPKWWTAKVVHGAAKSLPQTLAGVTGGVLGGPVGAGFGAGTSEFGMRLIPAYQEARAKGLDEDAAIKEAATVAAVSGGTAAIMGSAGMTPLFGTQLVARGNTAVAEAFKHPLKEALAQLGIVQPTIAAAGSIAGGMAQGRDVSPSEVLENTMLGIPSGAPFVALAGFQGGRPLPRVPEQVVKRPFEPTRNVPLAGKEGEILPPKGFEERFRGELTVEDQPVPQEGPTFYSVARRVVEEKGPTSASGSQWLSTLRNAPGVKEEELQTLNLPRWLEGADGKISKKDVLEHIEENQIRLEEVELSSKRAPIQWIEQPGGGFNSDAGFVIYPRQDGRWHLVGPNGGGEVFLSPQDAQHRAQGIQARITTGNTQYGEWVLPGPRERYGELLLKMPVSAELHPLREQLQQRMGLVEEARRVQDLESQTFRAPHFATESGLEENLLAHARYTERTDRDGKRTLFIEEIQSDWHQQGRERGYRRPDEKANYTLEGNGPWVIRNNGRFLEDFNNRQTAERALELYQQGRRQDIVQDPAVPDAPFKSTWHELVFKRMLRYAADNGFERIAWTNGNQQIARYPGLDAAQAKGMREFYDGILPRTADKWAKKLGMERGETAFDSQRMRDPAYAGVVDPNMAPSRNRVRFLDVSPVAGTRIRMGLPLFEESTQSPRITSQVVSSIAGDEGLQAAARQGVRILEQFQKRMGFSAPIDIQFLNDPNWRGLYGQLRGGSLRHADNNNGRYLIKVNLASKNTPELIFQNLSHEFGHYIMYETEKNAPNDVTMMLHREFAKYRQGLGPLEQTKMREVLTNRISAVKAWNELTGEGALNPWLEKPLLALTPEQQRYWAGYEEWFAESVARWATTEQKPLSIVDKFFSSLGRKLREVLQRATEYFKKPFDAPREMSKWLDSMLDTTDIAFGADKYAQMQMETLRANQRALDREGSPYVQATEQTPATISGRTMLDGAGAGDAGKAWGAWADRFNKFYSVTLGLPQIAELNKHIVPLQLFNEMYRIMNTVKNNIWDAGSVVGNAWKHLSGIESRALGGFIDDYMNGRFMPLTELKKNGLRMPTPDEAAALAKKHGLTEQGFRQFEMIREYFRVSNERFREELIRRTKTILDPVEQAKAIDSINKEFDARASKPYMPAMRFGEYTIEGRNIAGDKVHFERYETLRQRKNALNELKKLYPDIDWSPGFMAKDARPLTGMPRAFLDMIAEKMSLSPTQKAHLEDLKLEQATDQSFAHRFQRKELTPGYSQDWQRAFANYVFHEGNYFARVKYVDQLQQLIRKVGEERHTRADPTKVIQIRNYLSEVMRYEFDPKSDWAALRSMAFPWYLGYVVRAAALNTTQVPLMSWPHLASKFGGIGTGDARAAAALVRSMTSLNTYYKKATLAGTTERDLRFVREALNDHLLHESQGAMLAATGEGRNLLKGFGSSAERGWQSFNEWGAVMFQGAEHWNRMVTFRAATDLAVAHPEARYVQESIQKHNIKYRELIDSGWSKQDAAAFVTGRDAVEQTQYIYSPYARPKMMQGKLGAVLVFKSFTLNTLFNLWNNKAAAGRTMLLLAGAAGLSGLPFAEDINSLVKGVSARFFGKDYDLDTEVRRWIIDMANGKIAPDLLLHGVSRYGFGMPQVAEMMGSLTGYKPPLPGIDMSSAIGMGQLLPADIGKLITPKKDITGTEVREIQRASGAIFGLGFSLYNFAMSDPFTEPDAKKWEQIMPSAMRNASQAFRWYREGFERNKLGTPVLRFDANDTAHMAEIIAKGVGGFQPARLSQRFENIQQKAEATQYWDVRRELLMKQMMSAVKDRDQEKIEEMKQAIKAFNAQVPEGIEAKRISGDDLRRSLQQRLRTRALQERGLPTSRRNIGIYREIDKLYPEGAPEDLVDVRRVR